ncbi:OmpA family protein [Lysobacter capsici]|uniref:OmpA family protein n=1 Tax=Lysobacter capsici TaxID=435897 RepID=UPI0030B84C59
MVASSAPEAAPTETGMVGTSKDDAAATEATEPAAGGTLAEIATTRNARLYFDVGSSALPANASVDLANVLATLKSLPDEKARISGFHDETGSAATNAELAKKRAQAVQQWFESQGIVANRIVLDKPAVTEGGGKPEEARRVEVSVE